MRAMLGLGAALVMPATLSTITATFPTAQRAKAVGTWAGVAGASAILGLLTSGLVLEQWSWRAVFAVNIVLALAAIIGTLRVVPESTQRKPPAFDWMGGIIAFVALGLLVYSVIEAPAAGWASARTLVGLGAGVVLLAVFIGWERGRPTRCLIRGCSRSVRSLAERCRPHCSSSHSSASSSCCCSTCNSS
jgi:MFS family permease